VSKPPSPFLWCAVGGLLLAGTGLFATADATRWDWQPALALAEPWRWWTAAFVHWSRLHLVANLTGLLVVMALGWAARLPAVSAVAWFIAWPLTQLGLLLRPELTHFGGLSGVLHAGVAVAGWRKFTTGRPRLADHESVVVLCGGNVSAETLSRVLGK